ncbi:hypothetical protein [Paenibacillus sp. FSL H8-0034]
MNKVISIFQCITLLWQVNQFISLKKELEMIYGVKISVSFEGMRR